MKDGLADGQLMEVRGRPEPQSHRDTKMHSEQNSMCSSCDFVTRPGSVRPKDLEGYSWFFVQSLELRGR